MARTLVPGAAAARNNAPVVESDERSTRLAPTFIENAMRRGSSPPSRSARSGTIGRNAGSTTPDVLLYTEIAPVTNAGGYPGAPYFRITIAGTERALTAIAGGEVAARPYAAAPEQLWRIDQVTDGSYRISPKSVPGTAEMLALSAVGSSMPTLARFDPASDRQRWLLGAP